MTAARTPPTIEPRQVRLSLGRLVVERARYQLEITLGALLDLRQPSVRTALGLRSGIRRFLDVEVARATATFVRRTTSTEALLVPSMAFLDDSTCWNLALFLEKLPRDLSEFITLTPAGSLRVAP